MNAPVYAYKRGPSRAKKKNDAPEHLFQVQVAQYLRYALPDGYIFTASQAGAKMSKATAGKAKAAGQSRGWPDIQILGPDNVTRYIELKAPGGTLTLQQREFANRCVDAVKFGNPHIWAAAWTIEHVETALHAFRITPRRTIAQTNRYSIVLEDEK